MRVEDLLRLSGADKRERDPTSYNIKSDRVDKKVIFEGVQNFVSANLKLLLW